MKTRMTRMHSAKEKKDGTGILDARIFYFF
jgi:hypothetical protein